MPNTDIIDNVVSKEEYKNVIKFTEAMDMLEKKFVSAAQAADIANAAISGSKGIKELQASTEKLNEENAQLIKLEKQIAVTSQKRSEAESLLSKQIQSNQVAESKSLEENIEKRRRLQSQISGLKKEAAEELKLRKQNVISSEEYTKRLNENGVQVDKLKFKLSQLNKEARDNLKLNFSTPNSRGSAQAQNAILQSKVSRTDVNDTKKIEELNALIDRNNKLIDDNSDKLAKQKINIGNYPTAFTGAFKVLNTELEKVNNKLAAGATGKELSDLTVKQSALNNAIAITGKEFSNTASQQNAYKEATKQLGIVYGTNDKLFKEFNKQVGAGTTELNKVEKQVISTSNGSDKLTKGFKGVFSALRNIANIVPGLGLGGLVFLLLTPIIALGKELFNTSKIIKQTKIYSENLNEVLKESASGFGKAKVEVSQMAKEIDLAKRGLLDKEVVLKKFNETIGETIGQTNDLKVAEKSLNDNAQKYIDFMFAKEQATAAFALASKAAEESVKNQSATTEELTSNFEKIKSLFKGQTLKSAFGVFDPTAIKKSAEELVKIGEKNRGENAINLQNKYNSLLDIGNKKLEESGSIATANNFKSKEQLEIEKQKADELKKLNDKRISDAKKARDEAKKLAEDLAKFNSKLSADELKARQEADQLKIKQASDTFKRIADNEKISLQERLLANGFYYGALQTAITNNAKFEKEQLVSATIKEKEEIIKRKLSQDEKAALLLQINSQLVAIEKKTQDEITAIHREGIANQNKLMEENVAGQIESLSKASEGRLSEIKTAESLELAALKTKFKYGNITQEQYEQEKLIIQRSYNFKRLKEELDTAEEFLRIAKAAGNDTTKAEEDLARIKLEIQEAGNKKIEDKEIASINKRKAKLQEIVEDVASFGNQIFDAINSVVDAGVERRKNALEKEKNLIDERYNAELAHINKLNIAESDKADKIKILDANVQAQKELIAKRQRQLDIQRAKADKLKGIFDIGINIATRQIEALKYLTNPLTAALYPGIAAFIGVMGAVQLAAAIAKPIPEYWTGTEDSKGGPVWLGERGKELLITPDNKAYETPGTATMANIPAHSKVINNTEYMRMIRDNEINTVLKNNKPVDDRAFLQWQMKQSEKQTEEIVHAIMNAPQVVNKISAYGIQTLKKSGNNWNEYIDKKVRFKN